jgi:hypothetical protein
MSTPKFLLEKTSIDEVHQIITCLRGSQGKNDGDFRSIHLGIILEYLQSKKREEKSLTLQKLALMLGMSQRQIRENYFDGLLGFGVIQLTTKCNEWFWVGLSALTKKDGEL